MITDRFSIINSIDERVAGEVRYVNDGRKKPALVVLHGFKGFKDWGFFPHICTCFAERGAIVVSFNFALNGIREGSDIFDDLDKFARNTISQEIADVETVVRALRDGSLGRFSEFAASWNGELYLLGHSRGGGVALISAGRMPEISKIATWAAVARFNRFTDRQREAWKTMGVLEAVNARTKQTMRMNLTYLEDLESHGEDYIPAHAISRIVAPVLLVHGEQDLTVPVTEADTLAQGARGDNVQKHIIPATGHTFGAGHPFQGPGDALEQAITASAAFFGL